MFFGEPPAKLIKNFKPGSNYIVAQFWKYNFITWKYHDLFALFCPIRIVRDYSLITRSTSSIVVIPRSTLRRPSSNMVA